MLTNRLTAESNDKLADHDMPEKLRIELINEVADQVLDGAVQYWRTDLLPTLMIGFVGSEYFNELDKGARSFKYSEFQSLLLFLETIENKINQKM